MAAPHSRLLDPVTLAGIRDLRLLARTVVEGFLAGQHVDRRPARGVEFSQYRSYQPGDDLRRVDWRVYARSDRFFVRESEVERDLVVRFLLDSTASMAHADQSRDREAARAAALSKLDYARFLVAALAYLVELQGDRPWLQVVGGRRPETVASTARDRSLGALLDRLEGLVAQGRWPAWEEVAVPLAGARRRELLVLVSDLHQHGDELAVTVRRLAALGHELLVLQLVARDELDFGYQGDLVFEDLETGERVRGHAPAMRAGYLERQRRELDEWRRRLLELRAGHELLPIDQPLDQALRGFLRCRRRLP
jgi:uncharacterized protein (DUF58 family)